MNSHKLIISFLKILLFFLFFCLISLVIEMTFFNKDFFFRGAGRTETPFDYYWIRHLAVFLVLAVTFVIQKKQIHFKNVKPYSALFLFLVNIVPGISFLSKYFVLFLSFLLFLYIKSDKNIWRFKHSLRKNLSIIVFFFVLFILLFPLLFKEGYLYDPLSLFRNLPGYRLSPVSGLRETTGAASDLFDAFLPEWRYTYQSIREGVFPLWRYNKGLGVSLYGQSYHPEKLISFIVKPSEALTLRVLLKLFLSMMGMFFLLRAMKIKDVSSIIGGVAYALSGFIIGWLHGPQSSVAYHIPFLFLFLIKFLQSNQIKFLFYFAIWCGLAIYSGFLAVAGYSFYAVGLFLVIFLLFSRQRWIRKIKAILKISLFWILGMVTVSFSFVLLFYSAFISKSLDITYRQVGRVFFLPPKYFMNILFPSYHGWDISPEIRPYVSSVLLLFLILGLLLFNLGFKRLRGRIDGKEQYFISFFLLLIPFIMAMFGLFPFYQLSCKLPVLNSSPLSRLQSMTCFILVVLGALGLESFTLFYHKIKGFYKKRKYLFWALTEILFLAAVFMAITSLISEKEKSHHAFYPVFILLSLVILAFQLSIFLKRKAVFFLIILLPLVTAETVIQNRRYVPVNKKIHFITETKVPVLDFIKKNSRKHEGSLSFDGNFNIGGTLGNYDLRETIVHEFHPPDYRALIVDTFTEKSFATPTAPYLLSWETDFTSSFIQLMGVKYLIFRFEFDGQNLPPYYRLVYDNLDGKVYENRLYRKSRGIFFGRPKFFRLEDREEVIESIKSMDYSKYVYIEGDGGMDLMYSDPISCSVRIIEYTPNRVIYRYQASSDGILTFSEEYDRGWSVTVDGRKSEVLKTNLIFRGVAVRKGKGEIIFRYHVSKVFKILVWIGLTALLTLVGLYLFSDRIRNKARK